MLKFNQLDLFSGIGGFSLAAQWTWGEEHNIKVKINKRSYKYYLSSEYAYDKAIKQYQAGQHGRCLAVLNKFGEL